VKIIIISQYYHNLNIQISQTKNKMKDTKGGNALIGATRSRGRSDRKSEKVFTARKKRELYGEVIQPTILNFFHILSLKGMRFARKARIVYLFLRFFGIFRAIYTVRLQKRLPITKKSIIIIV